MDVCVCAPPCVRVFLCLFAFISGIEVYHRGCSVYVFRDLPINSFTEIHLCMVHLINLISPLRINIMIIFTLFAITDKVLMNFLIFPAEF